MLKNITTKQLAIFAAVIVAVYLAYKYFSKAKSTGAQDAAGLARAVRDEGEAFEADHRVAAQSVNQ